MYGGGQKRLSMKKLVNMVIQLLWCESVIFPGALDRVEVEELEYCFSQVFKKLQRSANGSRSVFLQGGNQQLTKPPNT